MEKKKTSMYIKEETLKDFDLLAKSKGLTRSALLTNYLNQIVEENKEIIKSTREKIERESIKENTEKLHEDLMLKENW